MAAAGDIQEKQFQSMFSLLPDDLESVTARAIHKVPRLI